jgi:hypothetical protein
MPSYITTSNAKSRLSSPKSDSDFIAESSPPLIGFALDSSDSMRSLARDAISGFNTLLAEQQKLESSGSKFTLATFSDAVRFLYESLPISEVPPLSDNLYAPSGSTALNDAIGQLILHLGKQAQRFTRVLVAILTDGMDTSSHQFGSKDILQMVSYRRLNYDWQFVFIGPKEALSYALSIGIPKSNIVEFNVSADGIGLIMDRLSKTVRAYQLGDQHFALQLHAPFADRR